MRYLSLDTEATGLTDDCQMIQLAFVPVDCSERVVHKDLGIEFLVQCPSFESLKPTLNPWVVKHNEALIRSAHADGIPIDQLSSVVQKYLDSPGVSTLFGSSRIVLLGKSLSALDIPLLTRTFGETFMQERFHHHNVDITCITRYLVDVGKLPAGCESTSGIIKHLGIRDSVMHTALSDALDMAEVYLKLLEIT